MQNQAASTVRLHVVHSNLKAKFVEVRLDRHVSTNSLANTRIGSFQLELQIMNNAFLPKKKRHEIRSHPYSHCFQKMVKQPLHGILEISQKKSVISFSVPLVRTTANVPSDNCDTWNGVDVTVSSQEQNQHTLWNKA